MLVSITNRALCRQQLTKIKINNMSTEKEQKTGCGQSASGGTKPHVICSSCHAPNSIKNNKVEIDIGDEQCSVTSVQFGYCEKCGWRGDVEWFD